MITPRSSFAAIVSLPLLGLASCGSMDAGDSASTAAANGGKVAYDTSVHGTFDEPWALAFAPGTKVVFITEKAGTMKFVDTATGRLGTVSGVPEVDYGGQGGFGDVAFLASEASDTLDRRTIYLSWAEAGNGETRGAVVGRGTLVCEEAAACRIEGLNIIWKQTPKVTGRGHYSHRIALSPDESHLFIASGDRQKLDPAQDNSNTLGTIVRLTLDGKPAAGNPFADKESPTDQIWSYGHRNILGLAFDANGQLWDLEHGPAGGDELNKVIIGANYGWPLVSDGEHYNGDPIPDHSTQPQFATAEIGWTPVIAPGDMIFYSGDAFPSWAGDVLIAGLSSQAIVQVDTEVSPAKEVARYSFDRRLRDIAQGPDGNVWLVEDGEESRLLKLSPED